MAAEVDEEFRVDRSRPPNPAAEADQLPRLSPLDELDWITAPRASSRPRGSKSPKRPAQPAAVAKVQVKPPGAAATGAESPGGKAKAKGFGQWGRKKRNNRGKGGRGGKGKQKGARKGGAAGAGAKGTGG